MKLVIPLCLIAAACGGSNDDSPPVDGEIARIEISPASVMLTREGDQHALVAQAFAADGTPIATDVTWASSRPAVDVDAAGTITANQAVGASQLVASAEGVSSSPALVTIVTVAEGVTVISDGDVVELPHALDGAAEDLDAPYEATLRGAPPAPGTLVLGGEGVSIGGEVVSSVAEGENSRVTLKLVPLPRLIAQAALDETIDGTPITPDVPPELAAAYDITFVDGTYSYTPKRDSKRAFIAPAPTAGSFSLPPIGACETSLPSLPISLAGLPQFSAKLEPTFQVTYNTVEEVQRIIVKAEPSFKATIGLVVNVDATFGLECKSPLYSKLLKFPGWAGLILSGEVEAGIAFELEGKINVVNAGVELSTESTSKIEMGIECLAGNCSLVNKIGDLTNTNKVQWVVPSLGQIRFEPAMFGGGYAALKLGATLIKQARIEMVKAKVGGKYEASLAPATLQTEDTDPDYRSSYQLSILGKVGAGKKLGGLLAKLGVAEFIPLELSTSVPLAASPKGTATSSTAVFVAGDVVTFKVQLDPTSIALPGLGYNVKRIKILHKRGSDLIPIEIATIEAAVDQVDFDLSWTADVASTTAGNKFFAFVETVLPSIVDLELAKALPGLGGAGACAPLGNGTHCVEDVDPFHVPEIISRNNLVIESRGVFKDGVELSLPAGFFARALNDNDELAGLLGDDVVVVKNGVVTSAIAVPPGLLVGPISINNRSEVAFGFLVEDPDADTELHGTAIRRRDAAGVAQPVEFLTAPGGFRHTLGPLLNDQGVLAFTAVNDDGIGSPFILRDGTTSQVPITGFVPTIVSMDATGSDLVGNTTVEVPGVSSRSRGFRRVGGVVSLLPLLSGADENRVVGVSGDLIVGTQCCIENTDTKALFWIGPNATPHPLSDLIDTTATGLTLTDALAMSPNGVIIALANNAQQSNKVVRLTPTTSANLAVEIVAPPSVSPNGDITYGVNLRNFGPTAAADVRAEFTLPDGYALVDAIGWETCTTTLSTVVCRAAELASGEQRAFLVTVVAPAEAGVSTVLARVTSATHDRDYTNNERQATTEVK